MNTVAELNSSLVGRYLVEREIGRGGMATVYLARDVRHDRKVAIKVLLPELAAVLGAERFATEMKVTANLQHPHILPLFDSGVARNQLFYVMPFVDGESLRDRLNREQQLSIDDAVRITCEVAGALHYAHRHGVVHRDIKPENILLHDGSAVVADFGIALAVSNAGGTRLTQTGLSLGTPQYMSPEQATGDKNIDGRTDVYSLGCVLYEMLTGEPPFTGHSSQAIVARVLTETVRPVRARRDTVSLSHEKVVIKALQKAPADRFATAGAFAEALGDAAIAPRDAVITSASSLQDVRTVGAWIRSPWSWAALLLIVVLATGFVMRREGVAPAVTFTQRTFDSHAIFNARFTPDGQTIVFSAAGDSSSTPHLYLIRPDNPTPQPLGPDSTHLLAISSTGQLAVLTHARYLGQRLFNGTLATVPLSGEAPREIATSVREADWSPDGKQLAVIRSGPMDKLEYPAGTVLAKSAGYFSDVRVSPSGILIAFFEHAAAFDDRGAAMIIARDGHVVARSPEYWGLEGLAWSTDGQYVVFSGASGSTFSSFAAYSLEQNGRVRQVLASAGGITVLDIARDGRRLATMVEHRAYVFMRGHDASRESRAGVGEFSTNPIVSADGRRLTFADEGYAGGPNYSVMMRTMGGAPVRLGEGAPLGFSHDGTFVLGAVLSKPPRLMMYPTGPGEPRRLDHGQFEMLSFLPTGEVLFDHNSRFFACGAEAGKQIRCYIGSTTSDFLSPVTPEGTDQALLAPDGSRVLARIGDSTWMYSIDGGQRQLARGLTSRDVLVRWSPDGREVWVTRDQNETSRIAIDRVNPVTGERATLTIIRPLDRADALQWDAATLADNHSMYAYAQFRNRSTLFVVEGAR